MTDPFRRSPELEAIATRWLEVYATRRSSAAASLLSSSEALTYIGSAEDEIWTGGELRDAFVAYTDDQAALVPENIQATGYEAGAFGWVVTTLTIHAPQVGKRVFFRNTFIFTLEEASWRIVHVHNSNPKPNMDAMGYDSRGLEELVTLAREAASELAVAGSTTVMFTDIADSTALTEALGDTRWAGVVQDHVALISDQIGTHGGRLIKSLGDGTMSSFASAGSAMQAACDIQNALCDVISEPHLQVRIGLHTGDVVEAGNDFFGSVVNKAARVASATKAGEIRISDATRAMVGGAQRFTFSDPFEVLLKGLEGEHLLHRLEWRKGAAL